MQLSTTRSDRHGSPKVLSKEPPPINTANYFSILSDSHKDATDPRNDATSKANALATGPFSLAGAPAAPASDGVVPTQL